MARKKAQSFEDSLDRVEEIVEMLESGEVGIEESIELYKEGMELSKHCYDKLNDIEKQVLKLQENENGEFEYEQQNTDNK